MSAMVSTKQLALAAFWLSRGLEFMSASAVEDPKRVELKFADPLGREPELTAAFFGDASLHALLISRDQLVRAMDRARVEPSRRCTTLPEPLRHTWRPRAR